AEVRLEAERGELQAIPWAVRPQVAVHARVHRLAMLLQAGRPRAGPPAAQVGLYPEAGDHWYVCARAAGGIEGTQLGQAAWARAEDGDSLRHAACHLHYSWRAMGRANARPGRAAPDGPLERHVGIPDRSAAPFLPISGMEVRAPGMARAAGMTASSPITRRTATKMRETVAILTRLTCPPAGAVVRPAGRCPASRARARGRARACAPGVVVRARAVGGVAADAAPTGNPEGTEGPAKPGMAGMRRPAGGRA